VASYTTLDATKTFFVGTHRVCSPEQTRIAIEPLLSQFGVTRVADVTGLDSLNIPVYMSIRPLAATLTVSQGKGATHAAAWVSAAMEAIELWCAERIVPPPLLTQMPAAALDLGYQPSDLLLHPGGLYADSLRVDWIPARRLTDDAPTLVPRASVQMGYKVPARWQPRVFAATSNGLASGNNRWEATCHALYEAIERDAIADIADVPVSARRYVDLSSVDSPYCRLLIEQIRSAGAWLEAAVVPSRFGVPCFACYLWSEDFAGAMVVGSGAHIDPAVALSRAIAEAAQSRLTIISGARDDIHPLVYRNPFGTYRPPTSGRTSSAWLEVLATDQPSFDNHRDEAAWLAEQITKAVGVAPLVVDLSPLSEIAVVKVLSPRLLYLARHEIPRPEGPVAT
jgi:YcaO-like protein with predicted kinase domain